MTDDSGKDHMDFFKNLIVKLSATGPAATISVFALCIAVVGIWGQGAFAASALASLQFLAILFIYKQPTL
ncbi:MAG: hypothetical protein IPM58_10570 [Nitrospira sp.]|nr:hypothetical protein [Nitrospira sp.]